MTGFILAILLALACAGGIALAARVPLRALAPLGTALMLGLAGYAWQGSPALPGKPVKAGGERPRFDEALAEKRRSIGDQFGPAAKWLVMSDGLARHGDSQAAANVLLSGLREAPRDINLWVGLGNALVAHGEGMLSPAATYAFRQALAIAPDAPGPNYFYGLALAESGDFESARSRWAALAARLPEGAELRAELERNNKLLDALIARRNAPQGGTGAP